MHCCVIKKPNYFNHDCLPILIILCAGLCILPAYVVPLAALSNAVCLHNASFFIDLCKCLLFSCFVLVY